VGVVSKPPAPLGRKKTLTPSQVHAYQQKNSDELALWTPVKASDEQFLQELAAFKPDLCITASYGNYLPKKFLAIPKYGTLNIHPSLLPRWRGAAPLQRSLQNGDKEVGVTVLFTVSKMDAGPILTQCTRQLEGSEQFPDLVSELMATGTRALADALPEVWAGTVLRVEQDEELATEAPKFANEDSEINFRTMNARTIHNLVRALKGTFGTFAALDVCTNGENITRRTNILTTVLLRAEPNENNIPDDRYGLGRLKFDIIKFSLPTFSKQQYILRMICGDGSEIGITSIHPATRAQMTVQEFVAGLNKGREIYWTSPPPSDILPAE
jgi:methionyl-tRNA formyltransferase